MGEDISLDEVAAEYASTLKDLVCNSKPLISTLTMLADDYQAHSRTIVDVIERHILDAPAENKLPGLYLIDSICKNIGGVYIAAFSNNIVSLFSGVFEKVDETTRGQMYKLRQTWVDIFSAVKLNTIDRRVKGVDPAWPLIDRARQMVRAAVPPPEPVISRTVHVNPNVIRVQEPTEADLASIVSRPVISRPRPQPSPTNSAEIEEKKMRSHLLQKKKELFDLQARKLEMEAKAVQTKFEEYSKQYFATRPIAQAGTDKKFQVEKLNADIQLENIKLLQKENVRQLNEIHLELTTLSSDELTNGSASVKVAPPPSARISSKPLSTQASVRTVAPAPVRTATAAPVRTVVPSLVPPPRVMTVTPMPKVEIESKPVATTTSGDRGSRDPRRNRPGASILPRIEVETEPPTITPKSSVPSSPSKKSSSDISSARVSNKDPRLRMSGSKLKEVTLFDEIPIPAVKGRESPKSPLRQKSPARHATPPRSKIDSPVRAGRESSPARAKTKSRSGSPVRKLDTPPKSPPRKTERVRSPTRKRKSGKNKSEEQQQPVKVKVEVKQEKKETSPPSKEEKSSKGFKVKSEPEEFELPLVSVQEHGDVDLRTSLHLPPVIALPSPVSPIQDEDDLRLFGSEDIDMRGLPSLVERLSAVIRQNKDGPPKIPVAEEPEVPVPPPPSMPKKPKEEPLIVPPPPKLPKIPRKPKIEPQEKKPKVEEKKRKRETKERHSPPPPSRKRERSPVFVRSPIRKRERSPIIVRSPPRKRERERSPIPAIRSPLIERGENRSRSPLFRPHVGESPPRRRGWKAIKEEQDEKWVGHEFERHREREPMPERGLLNRPERLLGIRHVPFMGPEGRPRGRGGMMDRGFGRRYREDDDSADFIIEQAEEQLQNGIITKRQFTDIVNDVFHRRESRMLREAQRRDGFERPPQFPLGPRGVFPAPMHIRPLIRPLMEPRPMPIGPRGFLPRPALLAPPLAPGPAPTRTEENLECKVIDIDGIPREIRFYGETAIALMAPNDPRDLTFIREERPRPFHVDGQMTGQIRVGDDYKEFFFGNRNHMVRIGAPTRELFIDGKGYDFMFEGPDIPVVVDGIRYHVCISGPRPQVAIGEIPRTDLVVGKTEMILNGEKIVPVYLDAQEQKFTVKGKMHTFKFDDSLRTVFFDGVRYKPNFGGLPSRVVLDGDAHYVRFLSLPEGVIPGRVRIVGMKSEPAPKPLLGERPVARPAPPPSPGPRKLDRIASRMAAMANRPATGYSVDSLAPPPANVNIHDLFSKLLATGLVAQVEKEEPQVEAAAPAEDLVAKAENEALNSVELRAESLRIRRLPLIEMLYKGVQCNSCGLRFPVERTCQYSQHLDWHFRQNRREKAFGRKPQSRQWYYLTTDWLKFEEFGEEKGWFEGGDGSDNESLSSTPEPQDLPTVAVDSENPEMNQCAVCREPFDQFFHEDHEEWRLRDALRIDGKSFHSLCYEDFKSHGETGLFPGLDLPVEEEPEPVKPEPEPEAKPDLKEAELATGGELKTETEEVIPAEIKQELVEESPAPMEPEEPVAKEVDTSPPTPVVDEIIKEESERDLGTPVEDEKVAELNTVIDILESSEQMVCSLDGNLEVSEGAAAPVQVSKIKFNVSTPNLKAKEIEKVDTEAHVQWKHKEITVNEPAESEDGPPGEEPVVTLKPRMMGRKFVQMPLVLKGTEESGLCTIM